MRFLGSIFRYLPDCLWFDTHSATMQLQRAVAKFGQELQLPRPFDALLIQWLGFCQRAETCDIIAVIGGPFDDC